MDKIVTVDIINKQYNQIKLKHVTLDLIIDMYYGLLVKIPNVIINKERFIKKEISPLK